MCIRDRFHDPRVAAVTGRLVRLSSLNGNPHALPDEGRERVIFGGPERLTFERSTTDWFERANFGGIGQGANLAIRRSLFAFWPGFDERRGGGTRLLGAEEHHALFRFIDRGHQVVYTPAAAVYHPYPAADTELRKLRLREIQSASAHLALLLTEETGYRRRAAKYGLQAVARRPRPWRMVPYAPPLGYWDTARASVIGLARYLRTQLPSAPQNDR